MKTTVNSKIFGGGKYNAPEIEMYESVVERGFEESIEGVAINPWDTDDEELSF